MHRVAIIFLCLTCTLSAEVRVARIFGDGMVLQQQSLVNLWGWAKSGETLTVTGSWNGTPVHTQAGTDGSWVAVLETPEASASAEGFTITVEGSNRVLFEDVQIGEVWIVAGQSNMAMPLSGWKGQPVQGSGEALSRATDPMLRLRAVGHHASGDLAEDVADFWVESLNQWTRCTPEVVSQFSAVGFFFGETLLATLGVPIGLIQITWEGTSCESWTPGFELEQIKSFRGTGPWMPTDASDKQRPSVLWNGMVYPIAGYTIRGVAWYQGESNVGRAGEFSQLFPRMIEGWRREWGQGDFPFAYVQITPWDHYPTGVLPEFWEAQGSARFLPHTGMVPTLDLMGPEEGGSIHPSAKQPIGERLAAWALSEVYGASDPDALAPVFASAELSGAEAILSFDNPDVSLTVNHTHGASGFEVAGPDGQFFPAEASAQGNRVTVHCSVIAEVRQVRYAWSKHARASLLDANGLPVFPFRTEPAPHLVSHHGRIKGDGFVTRSGRLFVVRDSKGSEFLARGIEIDGARVQSPGFWESLQARTNAQAINLVRLRWPTRTGGGLRHSASLLREGLVRLEAMGLRTVLCFEDLAGLADAEALKTSVRNWMRSPFPSILRPFADQVWLEFAWNSLHEDLEVWQRTWIEVLQSLRSGGGGLQCPIVIAWPEQIPEPGAALVFGSTVYAHDRTTKVVFALSGAQALTYAAAMRAEQLPAIVRIDPADPNAEELQSACRDYGIGWFEHGR